jgi:alanyl-tRNA synthetase
MFTKDSLRRDFARDWKKHYRVKPFKELGFERKTCHGCGRHFWTLDEKRKNCPDPPCENYGFIGNPITRQKWDYVETWRQFERFFRKEGHASIPRYPVIDRWRPDLFFTIASIQDFQRIDQGNVVFEYPADPLVIPQMCLRFNDIPNVGVTGRHHTSFIMPGQHSFGKYWKDRCIELNFGFLNRTMGIPEKEIVYVEDVWSMPDFSAFGPCIETYSRGLELVNSVFMQFTKSGNRWKPLPKRVVDVGWGHERLVWFSQGTPTGYDAVFGPVVKWVRKRTGIKDSELFDRYSVLAGGLDLEQGRDLKKIRQSIARKLGTDTKTLSETVEPMQALYAIIDHVKTLLFATTDGGIPSNVGGGYNLRVLLRRALSFMKEFGFDLELEKVAELHAKHLHPMFPEITKGIDSFSKILTLERDRYEKTMKKAGLLIRRELEKGRIDENTLVRFYVSHGISPELVEKAARENKVKVTVPEDFYVKITEQHMAGEKDVEKERVWIDVTGMPRTKPLYYSNPYDKEFKAKVLKTVKTKDGEWVILDRTLFYPEGGGQPGDLGFLSAGGKDFRVRDVQKIGNVVVHRIDGKGGLKRNQGVRGRIDWDRRYRLMKMHTSTHIVAGAARKVIGSHVWQAGAQKGSDSSRIDLTHYRGFTDEETGEIERIANDAVKRDYRVEREFLPRNIAEERYGFVLYQGGASPGRMVRVINIGHGFDAEACGGVHLERTGEAGMIKVIRTDRIKDGVNRIEFTCGEKANEFIKEQERVAEEVLDTVKRMGFYESITDILHRDMDVHKELEKASRVFSVETRHLPKTIERFFREIGEDHSQMMRMKKHLKIPENSVELKELFEERLRKVETFEELSRAMFELWKEQRKEIESLRWDVARGKAKELLFKASKNQVFEVVSGGRKELIEIANELIGMNPKLTVVLSNESGDIIGMSRTRDMGKLISEICGKSGGSGGGNRELAQGRVELSKLLKIMGSFRSDTR